jgi:hypothetical protein
MRNPGRAILKAWYELLNGAVFLNTNPVPVSRTDVGSEVEGHYILLRLESSSTRNTNSSFDSFPVVIVDIVTRFANKIDDAVVFDISTEIDRLVFVNPSHHGLPDQPGFQIVGVTKQNETVLPEDDGATPKINRLISRYSHRVLEVDES